MRRITVFLIITISFLSALTGTQVFDTKKVEALSGSQFNAGRIIDDAVFFNPNTMSPAAIQSFLNSKVPVCDTWHAAGGGYNPPFTCLKDYSQNTPTMPADSYCLGTYTGGVYSSAQIIKKVADACTINPQVLLVLLQKEQSLITDTWPWQSQYDHATGYACPDTAACDPAYAGFFYQVYYAARQYQRYARQPNIFNYKANQNNFILYNPNTACGGSTIYIQNQATAGLYNYTPYQPNTAALNNLYETGDGCSAYGNRNFWRLFSDWFGSTTGPDYSWSIESLNYSGGDNIISQYQPETITLRARNTGRVPWYNHGDHPVRLGTWEPAGRQSGLFNASKLTTVSESVVLPNEIGTFTFTVTPTQTGTYAESLNIVAENLQWAQWPGFRPTIIVPTAYEWQVQNIIYSKGTGMMDIGETQLITLIAKNTGSATWSKTSGPSIKLATWPPDRISDTNYNWLSPTRVTYMNESAVAPGETAGFQFYVKMPRSGTNYQRLNLVAEGQKWFNDVGLTLYLAGKTFAWQPVWTSPSTGTYTVPKNTSFTLTIKAKNTGGSTWIKNGTFPVRLGTAAPVNRGSWLEHPSWLNPIRPGGLIEDSVAPGQEGTFSFTVKTPNVTGLKVERFNLVAEGIAWFEDPGYKVEFNVY